MKKKKYKVKCDAFEGNCGAVTFVTVSKQPKELGKATLCEEGIALPANCPVCGSDETDVMEQL